MHPSYWLLFHKHSSYWLSLADILFVPLAAQATSPKDTMRMLMENPLVTMATLKKLESVEAGATEAVRYFWPRGVTKSMAHDMCFAVI